MRGILWERSFRAEMDFPVENIRNFTFYTNV